MFVPILAYHKIQNAFELGVSYTTPEQFERQIRFLAEQGFKTTTIFDYVRNRCRGGKNIIITFDDAYTSVYKNAFPTLQRFGYVATVFVITKYVGATNTWDYHSDRYRTSHCNWGQISELSASGWEVGSHTVSHPNLRFLSGQKRWHELMYSKDVLEHQLQKEVGVISYPFGSYDQPVIDDVMKAGYFAACTLGHNYPYDQDFPYALCRRGVYCFETLHWFRQKLHNNYWAHCDDMKQKIISRCAQSPVFLRFVKSGQKLLD